MKNIKIVLMVMFSASLFLSSCLKDLNVVPKDKDEITSATVFDTPESYKQFLAKIYGGLALTGQEGPAGAGDVAGIDEGESSYLRNYWVFQELTTDEVINHWGGDAGIFDFHNQNWSSSNKYVTGMYYRIYYQITLCNAFLRETTDEKLNDRKVGEQLKAEIKTFRAEARFLRALSYYHALDFFAQVPFLTEEDPIGITVPEQISRADLFTYIETELKEIEADMAAPKSNEYARADKAAVWTLLAKLYLNAEVYINEAKYTECISNCKKIINAGYSLNPSYESLFLADNHTCSGVILPIAFDGIHTRTWGGTTYLVHAAVGGNMQAGNFGIDDGWSGNTTTSAFVTKFPDLTGTIDKRAMFFTDGQSLDIGDYVDDFTQGYAVTKWKNISYTATDTLPGSDETFCDIDFPLFRLADVYLMYAEAVLRGGAGGDASTAIDYVNDLRARAYGDNTGNISSGDLNLDFILDERARELYWEGYRRTDLIRFGKFSASDYLWAWKGGVPAGISTDTKYDIFPIPASDIAANPNLVQNPGY